MEAAVSIKPSTEKYQKDNEQEHREYPRELAGNPRYNYKLTQQEENKVAESLRFG